MTDQSATPALPAATVVLLHDAADGLETVLLRRNSKLAFHGGAWVFPGGRIDAEDYLADAPHDDLAAARCAAVREAHEEAGLLIAPDELLWLAHWTTPEGRPHRYATWFFVAAASDGAVQVDGGEIHAHRWVQPAHALAAQRAGDIELPPPTFVTLVHLAAHGSTAEALTAIAAQRPETFRPRFCRVPGGACSLYEEDAGYATGDAERSGPRHRLWMLASGWRYERSA